MGKAPRVAPAGLALPTLRDELFRMPAIAEKPLEVGQTTPKRLADRLGEFRASFSLPIWTTMGTRGMI